MVTVERTLAFRFPDPNQPRKLFENPLGFLDPDYGRALFCEKLSRTYPPRPIDPFPFVLDSPQLFPADDTHTLYTDDAIVRVTMAWNEYCHEEPFIQLAHDLGGHFDDTASRMTRPLRASCTRERTAHGNCLSGLQLRDVQVDDGTGEHQLLSWLTSDGQEVITRNWDEGLHSVIDLARKATEGCTIYYRPDYIDDIETEVMMGPPEGTLDDIVLIDGIRFERGQIYEQVTTRTQPEGGIPPR